MKFDDNVEVAAKAGQLPLDGDSRPSIQLPGSRAPVFHGRKLLKCCWRFLLRGRCRLSSFARSFVARRFDQCDATGTAARNVFPMPLPYPEVLREGSAEDSLRGAIKRWVCGLVVCLNYLFLGRPRSAGYENWVGRPLTRKQWDTVQRLEHLSAAWFHVSPVDAEQMGRTAGKIETMNDILESLECQASALGHSGHQYFPVRTQDDRPGVGAGSSCIQIGTSESSSMSTFKPVDSSRLSFIGTPSFDPGPYLDPLSRRIFEDPLKERLDPALFHGRAPKLRVHCSRSEKIRLFELLDASNRLALFEAHQVTPQFGSGLFSVVKDMTRDRMILDSRGANCLEAPPGRWIKSLANGESLTKLHLEPHQELRMSGNDLRDFYYLFQASESRARRNVLVGSVHPREVSHLHAYKPCHSHTKELFGSLASLAMGDCQAVELAQSCHLSMALQHGILQASSLLTMQKPLPRHDTIYGVVIDDFVAISKVPRVQGSCIGSQSEGALSTSKMQEVYKQVGLIPHEKKAFRDESSSTFWGVDVEGQSGLIRGSLKRAIPLAGILFKIAALGVSTRNLMQVVVGSLISLFLYRRRLLSLLDPLFDAYRGAGPQAILSLSGEVKSTLLLCGMLLPLAVTNLRAAVPEEIAASDASSWGEAAVVGSIPRLFGKEMLRHSLRRSVWSKLLAPADAWMKSHDLLSAEDELPAETYQSNPLFELCAEAPTYRLLFSSAKSGSRHINIGELRAALRTERLLGERKPSSRVLLGADSQVALGSLIKGRASSRALNQELMRSLPWMLGLDVYLECLYFHTKLNRGDDPTRGRTIRPASREWPRWMDDLKELDYESFDLWLHEHGLDDAAVSGLPPFDELLGHRVAESDEANDHNADSGPFDEFPTDPTCSDSGVAGGACQSDRCCPKAKLLPSQGGSVGRVEGADFPSLDAGPYTGSPNFPVDAQDDSTTGPFRGSKPVADRTKKSASEAGPQRGSKSLTSKAVAALKEFPEDMFVMPPTMSWPPESPGYLDIFSGERGVALALAKTGHWSLCIDLSHGPDEDVMAPTLQAKLKRLVELGAFLGAGGGPVCTSFSTAITPPVRSGDFPYGFKDVSDKMRVKIEEGNCMAIWFFSFLDHCLSHGLLIWIENPSTSFMFRLPEWLALLEKWPSVGVWLVDYCRYKMRWRKRTKFYTNGPIAGRRELCQCTKPHQLLRGRSAFHKKSWTAVAQAYPDGICRELAWNLSSQRAPAVRTGSDCPLAEEELGKLTTLALDVGGLGEQGSWMMSTLWSLGP